MTQLDTARLHLRATHRRVTWVPPELTLTRENGTDLRHTVELGYPSGTLEIVRALEDLGVQVDASRRVASAALKKAGQSRTDGLCRLEVQPGAKDLGGSRFPEPLGNHPLTDLLF